MVDLYKLKMGQNKPYIKHIGCRALTIKEIFSIYSSTNYFHDKVVDKNGTKSWEEPGTLASWSGMKPNQL